MKKLIQTEIIIHATPEKVWKILTDFENYPKWNPFIKSLEGIVRAGSRITVKIQPPGAGSMTFKPRILIHEVNKELRWIGHLLMKGLFDGEHIFELQDNKNGTTTFRQSEEFNGILVRFIDLGNTKKGFEMMNLRLKELAEQHT